MFSYNLLCSTKDLMCLNGWPLRAALSSKPRWNSYNIFILYNWSFSSSWYTSLPSSRLDLLLCRPSSQTQPLSHCILANTFSQPHFLLLFRTPYMVQLGILYPYCSRSSSFSRTASSNFSILRHAHSQLFPCHLTSSPTFVKVAFEVGSSPGTPGFQMCNIPSPEYPMHLRTFSESYWCSHHMVYL